MKSIVEGTKSGIDIKNRLHGPIENKEGQLIVTDEPRPQNAMQLQIDLTMDVVNDFVEE